jgi:acyl-lipid omega-6 desaturase (Delta-12 desaturase)
MPARSRRSSGDTDGAELVDKYSGAPAPSVPTRSEWKAIVIRFQQSSAWRAGWQLINTLVPYAVLWYAMVRCISVSYWLMLPLAVLAAGFLVRLFIIFHDCGHGSFFKSQRANDATGYLTGLLTLTPYHHWRWAHATHHGTSGDLDRRGIGDIWTLTVTEYLQSSRWRRFLYRLSRTPFVLFVAAPFYLMLIDQRFPAVTSKGRERRSVHWMNLAVLAMIVAMSALIGIKQYLMIQLTVTVLAGAAGVWLFYVQHQFEAAYWEHTGDWNYSTAALQGSSYYQLPKVLQWFSANIGFHHIHHLSPYIPNYNLQRCHNAAPIFQQIKPLTLFASLRSLTHHLWDEQRKKLISYRHLKELRSQGAY